MIFFLVAWLNVNKGHFSEAVWVNILGSRFRKLSSLHLEKMDSREAIEENSKDSHLSSAYDNAMEALSSLITCQKRGDRSPVGGKYEKLDRMLMYVKVTMLDKSFDNFFIRIFKGNIYGLWIEM